MISLYVENKAFYKQVQYVFSVIGDVLGVQFDVHNHDDYDAKSYDINIAFVEAVNDDIFVNKNNKWIFIINSKGLFSEKYLKKDSNPNFITKFILDKEVKNKKDIVSIYNNGEELYINKYKNYTVTNIDIVSDIFFMLSRYEEIVFSEMAEGELYNRFPAKESVAFRNGFLHRPIVNEQIELLWSLITELNPDMQRLEGWQEKHFAACFTHDVDWIEKHSTITSSIKSSIRLLTKHLNPLMAFQDFTSFIKSRNNYKKDLFWTFDFITDIEEKYGFRSSFYFLMGGETNYDNKYKYNDERVVNLISELDKDGFECGLHGSFNSYNNMELMKIEKERLDKFVSEDKYGIRQHYLRFKMPITLELQEKQGFLYDCTLGFADKEGFRCGICHPYKPYDIIEDRILDLWVLPLIVMETTIIDKKYSGCSQEEAVERVKMLIDETEKYGGVFTLLWHNSSLDNCNPNLKNWDKVYERIMEYLGEKSCFGRSGRDIVNNYIEARIIGRKNNE